MKQSINFNQFTDAFRDHGRESSFSYASLNALYQYFEQYEEDTDQEIELDVIAIDCDFTEYTIGEALEAHDLEDIEELQNNTTVIYVDDPPSQYEDREDYGDNTIVIQNY